MKKRLIVTAFPSAAKLEHAHFPEHSTLKSEFKEKSIGIAFSGGGTRSASCTLGQLKAFHETGLINKVAYISAVSGGGWTATPYCFIKQEKLNDFFGCIQEPQDIQWHTIKYPLQGSLQQAVTQSSVLGKLIKAGFSGFGDESYAQVIGKIFLAPFGLHHPNKYFSYNETTLSPILASNPDLTASDFNLCRAHTPFLVLGATLLNYDGLIGKHKYPVEYTPYYSGIRTSFIDKDTFTSDDYFGGGYIESFGYDCSGPYKIKVEGDLITMHVKSSPRSFIGWTQERAFSLSDIMASTGAAPQEVTNALGLKSIGFPEFYHIPITVPEGQQRVAEEHPHSDGAHLENLGIMALLARRLDQLYVFINTKCQYVPGQSIDKTNVNKSLKALFIGLEDNESFGVFEDNIVFENGEVEFKQLIAQFNQCIDTQHPEYAARTGLIVTSNLVTKENTKYGVKAGQQVTVTWVYNQRSIEWESKIAEADIVAAMSESSARFRKHAKLDNFPHYETFLENNKVIELSSAQTHLLVNHAYWVAKLAINTNGDKHL
ncbi:hypothetical protein [Shewanella gelidii]|uniref:PNPLA domain-containing protein n=1 Tax=Shewanella gelidii TaxID=1642821 RepID=A0A917JWV5_9GAMM|nr:hypothetical protein [Shewanella gelidii]MCL1098111.1 hypothetical protein [Shewanella gelidii]GGI90640.1 hypothetical protein GCM10009332_29870 [Shewanella gelidii]